MSKDGWVSPRRQVSAPARSGYSPSGYSPFGLLAFGLEVGFRRAEKAVGRLDED